jgi:hypothetical protein
MGQVHCMIQPQGVSAQHVYDLFAPNTEVKSHFPQRLVLNTVQYPQFLQHYKHKHTLTLSCHLLDPLSDIYKFKILKNMIKFHQVITQLIMIKLTFIIWE